MYNLSCITLRHLCNWVLPQVVDYIRTEWTDVASNQTYQLNPESSPVEKSMHKAQTAQLLLALRVQLSTKVLPSQFKLALTHSITVHYCHMYCSLQYSSILQHLPIIYHSLELWNTSRNTACTTKDQVREESTCAYQLLYTTHAYPLTLCSSSTFCVTPMQCLDSPSLEVHSSKPHDLTPYHTQVCTNTENMQRKACTPTSTLTRPHPHSHTPPLSYSTVAGIPQAPECPEPCCHIHWQLFQQYLHAHKGIKYLKLYTHHHVHTPSCVVRRHT